MTSQQLDDRSQPLEARVAVLEAELAQLKRMLSDSRQPEAPWWVRVSGSSENDPTFEDATRLGKEWRQSAE